MSKAASTPSVLIVGSGPAGLFAACELVRHGVKPRIVERRLKPHHETRGTALQPGVLDIIDRAGMIEPFINAGVHTRHTQVMGPGMRQIASADFAGLGSRYEFQCCQPQWRTEQILRDHLALRGVEIEYGAEVAAIEEESGALRVSLEVDGRTASVEPQYLLGAGGAHSVTRHSMREHLVGETYGGQYVVADVKLKMSVPPETARVIVGATGFVLFAPLPESRWLIFVSRDPGDARDDPPTAAELGATVNQRVGAEVGLSDLRWVSYFKMHRREAESLGDGRRFLLGDAGHMSSPLGGEGINAAFMDAADIAWKLALVLRGMARPSLLDTYAVERGIADAHALEVSNEIHVGVAGLVGAYATGGTPSIPPSTADDLVAAARRRSMLDVSYAGSPLVGQAGGGSGGPAPGERFPSHLRLRGESHHLLVFGEDPGVKGMRARWNGLVNIIDAWSDGFSAAEAGAPDGGAVLVRPDGFIGFRAAPANAETMAALDAHLARYLIPAAGSSTL
jgi:6-methylpretetramide 4-monooxygenase / 4-hydroxy-6-methylpretetramide 12a-monooxygenase